jgi:inward rectifier potassium channel
MSESSPTRPGRAAYKDGVLQFEARGAKRRYITDLYHHLLRGSWTRLFAVLLGAYAAVNCAFAELYLLGGDCIRNAESGSFADALWFSVQTFATIGYGELAPLTPYANALVSLEAFLGMISVALGTGLMFSKFSRPRARIGFSKNVVIGSHNGRPFLQFRMANERSSHIAEARVKVSVLADELTAEGVYMRRFAELQVERSESPVFALSWTVLHSIDEQSPLFGVTPDNVEERLLSLIVTFMGLDEASMQTVHTRHAYTFEDVLFDHRFADMMGSTDSGRLLIDHGRLHSVIPVDPRGGAGARRPS